MRLFCWAFLLGGFCASAYAQGGTDQGGITVTGDPTQILQSTPPQGGKLVIPDDQQPAVQAAQVRDEEAHKRLDGHKTQIAALRSDLDTFKAEYQQAQRFAVQGDMVRSNQARTRAFHARSRLRA